MLRSCRALALIVAFGAAATGCSSGDDDAQTSDTGDASTDAMHVATGGVLATPGSGGSKGASGTGGAASTLGSGGRSTGAATGGTGAGSGGTSGGSGGA